jgi:hypothetical protein
MVRGFKDKMHETNGRETRLSCVYKNLKFDFILGQTSPLHILKLHKIQVFLGIIPKMYS